MHQAGSVPSSKQPVPDFKPDLLPILVMGVDKALQACQTCRRLKRKCTRELPECALVGAHLRSCLTQLLINLEFQCERLRKPCHYPGSNQLAGGKDGTKPSEGGFSTLHFQTQLAKSPTEFPASFFLDPTFFRSLAPEAFVSVSGPYDSQIKAELGSDVESICSHYFSTVHRWLPMLSKKRLLNLLNRPTSPLDESQSLLLLCMRLASSMDSEDGGRSSFLYQLAKASVSASEQGCFISLRLVQCLVFLAVYELGHAIFPAAYLTIGQAARLGGMIGLHNKTLAQQMFTVADTWTYREEQRRTWWAIFVLDKYVNIGTQYIPGAIDEPCRDSLLPVNDTDWNEGLISASEPLLTTSFHATADLGNFAHTCQAAHTLLKVLKHRDHRTHSGLDPDAILNEALALHGALVSFEASLAPQLLFLHQEESGRSLSVTPPQLQQMPGTYTTPASSEVGNILAFSLSASARLILYKIYRFNEPESGYGRGRTALETEMQRVSLAGTRDLAMRIAPGLAGTTVSGPASCPMLASLSYNVATECAWLIKEDYDTETCEALKKIVGGLSRLATEWQVAKEYLLLLENSGIIRLIAH